jgi:hypothetical protein
MKASLAWFIALLATASFAGAQNRVIVYPSAPQSVVSPLTTPTAAANQALLNQINSTIQQRVFQHQVLTLSNQPQLPAVQVTRPIVISPR